MDRGCAAQSPSTLSNSRKRLQVKPADFHEIQFSQGLESHPPTPCSSQKSPRKDLASISKDLMYF
jgi:hypothetical protein